MKTAKNIIGAFFTFLFISAIVIAIILCIAGSTRAQSVGIPDWDAQVSISPYSIQLWGALPATAKLTASYGMVEIVFLHGFKQWNDTRGIKKHSVTYMNYRILNEGYQYSDFNVGGNYVGIFINPVQFQWNHFQLRGGVGWFLRTFPDIRGRNLNFQLQLVYMVNDWIGVSWSHISSGFHFFSEVNPGLDNLSLIVRF